jgi:2-aminoadipate transaminase
MVNYSRRVGALRSSEIRDLMKLATRPDMISFAGGMPNNDLFPIAQVDEIFNTLSDKLKKVAFQYGPTPGHPPLLEALKEHLRSKGMPVDTNEILITTGSIQAINILTQAFVDPGDKIILENPSFIGSISIFKSYMAEMVAIEMENDGINIEKLERELNQPGVQPKMLYLIPNFRLNARLI